MTSYAVLLLLLLSDRVNTPRPRSVGLILAKNYFILYMNRELPSVDKLGLKSAPSHSPSQ